MAGSSEQSLKKSQLGAKGSATQDEADTPTIPAEHLIAALNNSLRRDILRLLHTPHGPRSPIRASIALGQSVSAVWYHFKLLADLGLIEETRTAQRRGAKEHFYESKVERSKVVRDMLKGAEVLDALRTTE